MERVIERERQRGWVFERCTERCVCVRERGGE